MVEIHLTFVIAMPHDPIVDTRSASGIIPSAIWARSSTAEQCTLNALVERSNRSGLTSKSSDLQFYDLLLYGIFDQLAAIMQIQFLHQVCAVRLHSLDRQIQDLCNLPAGLAFCDQLQYFPFP